MKVVKVPLIVENILACEKAANTVKGHAHYEWGKPPKLCRKCKQTDKVEIKCFLRNFVIAELVREIFKVIRTKKEALHGRL